MLYFSRWKTAVVLGITAFFCLAALPNVLPARALERLPAWAQRQVPLGIDLAGGSHVVLAVDQSYVMREQVDRARREVRQILREARIAHAGIIAHDDGLEIRVQDKTATRRAAERLRDALPVFLVSPGDEIIRLKLDQTAMRDVVSAGRRASMNAIEWRLQSVGVEGTMRAVGTDRIVLDVSDPDALDRLSRFDF